MAVQQQYPTGPQGPPPNWTGGDAASLDHALRHVVGRMRWLRWVRCASFGALIGEVVALAAVVLAHFDLLPDWMMLEVVIPLCILLGAGIGTFFAYRRPVSLMDAARIAETRLGLKERLSSALEFERVGRHARDPIPSILVQLQQRDAAAYAGNLRPKEALPFKWPWQLKALIGMTAVLILALIVPNLPMFVSPAQRNERGIVTAEAKKLEQAARIIEKEASTQQLPHTKWAAQQMKRLAQQMSHGKMDKRQAFIKYGKLTQQMQNLQKQMAGQNGADSTKSLADAGRELAKSLQSQSSQNGQPGSTPKSPQSGQGGNSANASGSSKTGATGKNQNAQQHGFNVPGFDKNKPGGNQANNQPNNGQHASSEMQQAAKAMQQGDAKGLSQQLRQLAQRAASGQMSQIDKQQAAQDLQKLADALKGTPMNETQKHAQAAADAMKQGDTQRAADEMKKAADSADREMKNQQDRDAMRDAQNSLQKSQNEMAGASSPSDVNQSQQSGQQQGQSGDSGQNQSDQSGQGDSSGDRQGNGQGQGQNSEKSAENEMKSQGQGQGQGQGKSGNEPGQEGGGGGAGNRAGRPTSQHSKPNPHAKGGKFQGPPGRLNPNFDPSKFPKYNKIYLGKPKGGSAEGRLGKTMKTRPGPGGPHPVTSRVPYYDYVGPAKQAAEHAVDREDIPPSYQGPVRKYFDSLTPSH